MGQCLGEFTMERLLLIAYASLMFNVSRASVLRDSTRDNRVEEGPGSEPMCSTSDSFSSCVKFKSLVFLENLLKDDNPIPLLGDTLTLVRSFDLGSGGLIARMDVEELTSILPQDDTLKEAAVDELILSYATRFIKSRALQIRLPGLNFWNYWKSMNEGRKKKGGGGWAFLMAGGMMGALGLGSVALLAGKALMVSLMALMLSGMMSLRKAGGGGADHAATTYELINIPTDHGHHGRSFSGSRDGEAEAAELAYRAHLALPQKNNAKEV